jgi:hypothetical protein
MDSELFYKKNGFKRKSSLVRGLDDNCKEFSVSRTKDESGWIVSFERWNDPEDERSAKNKCTIWTKRHEVRIFKTLENVAKQLSQSGVVAFEVQLSEGTKKS